MKLPRRNVPGFKGERKSQGAISYVEKLGIKRGIGPTMKTLLGAFINGSTSKPICEGREYYFMSASPSAAVTKSVPEGYERWNAGSNAMEHMTPNKRADGLRTRSSW